MKLVIPSLASTCCLAWALLACAVSCTKELCLDEVQNVPDIAVVDGHLEFATKAAFEHVMDIVKEQASSSSTKSSLSGARAGLQIPGFTSLAQRWEELVSCSTRSRASCDGEMTQDEYEYELAKASDRLLAPGLSYVMDSSLVIAVQGRIYKITDLGTFSADAKDYDEFPQIIRDFDPSIIASLEAGETVSIGHNATFTHSFGDGAVWESVGRLEPLETKRVLESVGAREHAPTIGEPQFPGTAGMLCAPYGVETFTWENYGWFQKIFDGLRGKSVAREAYFDDDHRVVVRLYNVNYFFYAESGMSCHMQRKKQYLFIPFWVRDDAEEFAIGFDKLVGEYTYNNPSNYSLVSPSRSSAMGHFTGTIANTAVNFLYGSAYAQELFGLIKSFGEQVVFFVVDPSSPISQELSLTIYNAAIDEGIKQLKSLTGKYVSNVVNKIQTYIQPEDPRVGYLTWGTGTVNRTAKDFLTGVKHFGGGGDATLIFDRSFGFRVSFNGAFSGGGMIVSSFTIKNVDGFAAAKWNGRWAGVRFVDPQ